MLARLVLLAATAVGVNYYLKGRGNAGLQGAPGQRMTPGDGKDGDKPASSPMPETMWTPSDPADAGGARTPSATSS